MLRLVLLYSHLATDVLRSSYDLSTEKMLKSSVLKDIPHVPNIFYFINKTPKC